MFLSAKLSPALCLASFKVWAFPTRRADNFSLTSGKEP